MTNYEPIDFSGLEPIEIPVTIGDTNYILMEASGDSSAKFRNMMLNNTELVDGKPTKVTNYANVESYLVFLCLRYADGDKKDKQVPHEVVKRWPARVVKKLYETAKEISELDEDDDDEEQAKNEVSDTTDGSDSQSTAV
jgi:hypothetical protein